MPTMKKPTKDEGEAEPSAAESEAEVLPEVDAHQPTCTTFLVHHTALQAQMTTQSSVVVGASYFVLVGVHHCTRFGFSLSFTQRPAHTDSHAFSTSDGTSASESSAPGSACPSSFIDFFISDM